MTTTERQELAQVTKGAPDLGNAATELLRARNRLGISQSELSSRTGISRNAIMGYESGRNRPGAREIRLLCDALRITPNQLIYGKEEPFETSPINDRLGLSSDDIQAAQGTMFLQMLGRDERAAILTLVYSILEARHGKRALDKAMSAFKVATDFIADDVGEAVNSVLKSVGDDEFNQKVEDDLKKKKKTIKTK